MHARLDAADRLVSEVARRGAVPVPEAVEILLAVRGGHAAARAVLERVVADDARLELRGDAVWLAPSPLADVPLERARFCVVDLETTSLRAGAGTIVEIGAVLVEGGCAVAELELLGEAARSPAAIERLFAFGAGAVLAGHNLRFDLSFLEQARAASSGERIAAPVLDTLALARRLLHGRTRSFSLASLAELVGASEVPCHRALPDARATAELLVVLLALAVERGARTVADACALARSAASRREEGAARRTEERSVRSSSLRRDDKRARGRAPDRDRRLR